MCKAIEELPGSLHIPKCILRIPSYRGESEVDNMDLKRIRLLKKISISDTFGYTSVIHILQPITDFSFELWKLHNDYIKLLWFNCKCLYVVLIVVIRQYTTTIQKWNTFIKLIVSTIKCECPLANCFELHNLHVFFLISCNISWTHLLPLVWYELKTLIIPPAIWNYTNGAKYLNKIPKFCHKHSVFLKS